MNIPIYDGNPLWNPNATAVGFYNNDVEFQVDCVKVAKFVPTRLGYPLMSVELQDLQFYACFEESISEYSAQVNQFNIVDNLLTLR